jgi:hypothetical protein
MLYSSKKETADNKDEIKDEITEKEHNERYNQALYKWSSFINNAKVNYNFYLGNTVDCSWIEKLREKKREPIYENEIKRCILNITGEQRAKDLALQVNFSSNISSAIGTKEALILEELKSLLDDSIEESRISDTSIDTLRQGLITGLSFIHIYEEGGKFMSKSVLAGHPIGVIPFSETPCRFNGTTPVYYGKIVDANLLYSQFPDHLEIIDRLKGNNLYEEEVNRTFLKQGNVYSSNRDRNSIRIIELWTTDFVSIYIPEGNGKIGGGIEGNYSSDIQENIHFLETKKNLLGFVPFFSYSPEYNLKSENLNEFKYNTPVNNCKPLQEYLNKLHQNVINRITTAFNNAVVVDQSALENKQDIFSMSSPGKIIKVNQTAGTQPPIQPLTTQVIDANLLNHIQLIKESLLANFGLSASIMGEYKQAQETFALANLRQISAFKVLTNYLKDYDEMLKVVTRALLELNIQYNPRFNDSIRNQFFALLQSPLIKMELKSYSRNNNEQQLTNYIYTLEMKKNGLPVSNKTIALSAPVTNTASIISDIDKYEEAIIEQQKMERKLLFEKQELENKKLYAEINKLKGEVDKLKKET